MNALVLIAEDEREIVEILVGYLEREGFRTVTARDGQTAVELHQALRPDIVLLDVGLPKLDGWEVLAQLRRSGATPVIMLTALDQDLDKLQALRIGADDYVVKPFNPLAGLIPVRGRALDYRVVVIAGVEYVVHRQACAGLGLEERALETVGVMAPYALLGHPGSR